MIFVFLICTPLGSFILLAGLIAAIKLDWWAAVRLIGFGAIIALTGLTAL